MTSWSVIHSSRMPMLCDAWIISSAVLSPSDSVVWVCMSTSGGRLVSRGRVSESLGGAPSTE